MTGIEVRRRLAQDPGARGVPCVALSADAMPAPIRAAHQAGFGGYLTKPLDVAAFLRCVDEALAGTLKMPAPR
jgi:CheY-like chemotaxis protein